MSHSVFKISLGEFLFWSGFCGFELGESFSSDWQTELFMYPWLPYEIRNFSVKCASSNALSAMFPSRIWMGKWLIITHLPLHIHTYLWHFSGFEVQPLLCVSLKLLAACRSIFFVYTNCVRNSIIFVKEKLTGCSPVAKILPGI